MIMICWLLAVSSAQIDVLQATPALASALAAAAQDDHHAALLNDLRQRLSPEQRERLDAQRHDLFEASPMVNAHYEQPSPVADLILRRPV
jgi:hypothetical protein